MNHISDELINRYIDKETTGEELTAITEHITACDECLSKIKAARLAESALQKMNAPALSERFTENVMAKIMKAEAKQAAPEGSFMKIVFAVFIMAIGGAVGYGLSLAVADGKSGASKPGLLDGFYNSISAYFNSIRIPAEFRSFNNIEIVGAIAFISLLTAGYYLYESLKELKKRAGELR